MIVLHLYFSPQLSSALKMMKYSVNHPHRFSDPLLAFASGFISFCTVCTIEICNAQQIIETTQVLLIFKSTLTFSLIYRFNVFFTASIEDPSEKAYVTNTEFHKVLPVEVTTSRQAMAKNEQHLLVKSILRYSQYWRSSMIALR